MMTLGESRDGEIQVGELEILGRMMQREVGRYGGGQRGRGDEKDIQRGKLRGNTQMWIYGQGKKM